MLIWDKLQRCHVRVCLFFSHLFIVLISEFMHNSNQSKTNSAPLPRSVNPTEDLLLVRWTGCWCWTFSLYSSSAPLPSPPPQPPTPLHASLPPSAENGWVGRKVTLWCAVSHYWAHAAPLLKQDSIHFAVTEWTAHWTAPFWVVAVLASNRSVSLDRFLSGVFTVILKVRRLPPGGKGC